MCTNLWLDYYDIRRTVNLYLNQMTSEVSLNKNLNLHICLILGILMTIICFLLFSIEMSRKLCEFWWLQSKLVGLQYPYLFTYQKITILTCEPHKCVGFFFFYLKSYFLFISKTITILKNIFTPWNCMTWIWPDKTNHYYTVYLYYRDYV